ncbi:MAG: hypothetical protein E7280_04615 [Lachnospiraceae bacterium]|nr:hypothetical protein [Lachnospiraceae bacterium]
MRKKRCRAILTVEAAVIACVMMLTFGGFMQLSINMYMDCSKKSQQEIKMGKISPAKALRLKRAGGSIYEQFKSEHRVSEKTE